METKNYEQEFEEFRKKEERELQGVFVIAAIAYSVFGVIIPIFIPSAVESVLQRLLISVMFVVLFVLSFKSEYVKKHLYYFVMTSLFIMLIHATYMVFLNNFLFEYAMTLMGAIFVSAVLSRVPKHYGTFMLGVFVLIVFGYIFTPQPALSLTSYFFVVLFFSLVFFHAVRVRYITNMAIIEKDKKLIDMNQQLKRANEELRELDIKKDEFIKIATDSLKTPLTTIKSFSNLLQTGKIKDEKVRQQYLYLIDNNAARMFNLTQDLFDASRLSLGKLRIHIKPVDLKPVFREISESMAVVIRNRGIKPVFSMEKALPMVRADYERVIQVLHNLLMNSARFTQKGGIIQLRISRKGRYVQFEVSDTGIGIPRDRQKYIFSKFVKGGRYVKRTEDIGLGLSISKGLVELMDGRIWFHSKEKKGTTFYFTLPVYKKSGQA